MTYKIWWRVSTVILVGCFGALTAVAEDEEELGGAEKRLPTSTREFDRPSAQIFEQGGSAESRVGVGEVVDPKGTVRPPTRLNPELETNVDRQIPVVEEPRRSRTPEKFDRNQNLEVRRGGVAKTFTDTAGTGWDYCSGKCGMRTKKHSRAGGSFENVVTVSRGTCDPSCSCVLFKKNAMGKLTEKFEYTGATSGTKSIGQDSSKNYVVRCCE